MKTGKVYLVGAGPGDPGLLTVRGQELLRRADVVVYDHLVSSRLLDHCDPRAKRIYAGKEPSKSGSGTFGAESGSGTCGARPLQRKINALLVRAARSGKVVVRLKGGDPFLFGRGGEETLELAKAKVAYEIVPGVTSAIAVPAYAGIPVTHRALSSSVAILTGHEDPTKASSRIRWDTLATACDTLVCLMGVSTLPLIVEQLIRHGRRPTTPCAVIASGTFPTQRTVTGTLRTISAKARAAAIMPPAILVVGDVVSLRRRLNWFETTPLFGKRILVTRAADKAASLAERLASLGADVERLPAIELAPVKQNGVFRDAVRDIPQTDWLFFTSPEGIGRFAQLLKPYRKDVRWLSGCRIGAIGPKTAATIEAAGLHVDFVPKQFSQEGIVDTLPRRAVRGKRALILSAEGSRDVLEAGLREHGMQVKKIPLYRAVVPRTMAKELTRLLRAPFDLVTVTSASCVGHLRQALATVGKRRTFTTWRFASIGPVTSAAVRSHGGRVAVEATTSTIEGLVEAIVRAQHR